MQRPVVETGMACLRNKRRSVCLEHNDRKGDRKTQTIKRPCHVKCDKKPLEGLKWETNRISTKHGSWEELRVVDTACGQCYEMGRWLESMRSELGRHNTGRGDTVAMWEQHGGQGQSLESAT